MGAIWYERKKRDPGGSDLRGSQSSGYAWLHHKFVYPALRADRGRQILGTVERSQLQICEWCLGLRAEHLCGLIYASESIDIAEEFSELIRNKAG